MTHIHIKPPWLPEENFVAGSAAAVAVAGRFLLEIRLHFHNHAPHRLAIGLVFHQQDDEIGGNDLGGAGEEGLGEVLGGCGACASGFGDGNRSAGSEWNGAHEQQMLNK